MMVTRNISNLASCLIPFLTLFFLIVWTYEKMWSEIQTQSNNNAHAKISSIPHIRSVANRSDHESDDRNMSKLLQPKEAQDDIFTYKDPPMAGTGSYDEEFRRYNLFMSSQGVICHNIRHFGGMYMQNKNPPEFDPDGAWYLCIDPEVSLRPGSCIVYSIGINDEWSFDDSMANYGCRVYAFDPTMRQDDHIRSPFVQFFKVGLADFDSEGVLGESGKAAWKTRTLKTIITELRHNKRLVDVLKMDIEWDEWKCLPQMLSDGTLRKYVKQLDVEFHVVDHTASGIRRYYGIVMWLDRQGFKIAHMHRNMYCRECYETTFVNTNLINLPLR